MFHLSPAKLPTPAATTALLLRRPLSNSTFKRAASNSAMAPKVVCTRELPGPGRKLLQDAAASGKIDLVQWKEDRAADRQWILDNMKADGVKGLLCMLNDKVDKELISQADLKVVSSMSAGFDHIDLAALKEKKIRLGTTPDALTDAVADLSVMLAIMAARFGGQAMRSVLDGQWPKMPWSPLLLCGRPFNGRTFGFLGFGRIAQATLVRMMPYQPSKVLYMTSKPGKPASEDYYGLIKEHKVPIEPVQSLDELAKEVDVLFVCCALTDSTKGLVGDDFISKMKNTAVIVNTARGPVVDSDALAKALKEERLLGAGLDVLTGEPNIGADHPLVQEQRAVVLPHIGSATVDTRELMSEQAVQNLLAGLEGTQMVSEKPL